MKQFITLAVVVGFAYLGYKFEPALRETITGIPYAVGHKIPADLMPKVDLATLRQDQLPKEISILSSMPFKHKETGLFINVPIGSKHQPIKVVPPNVHLRVTGTKYQVVMPIAKTDLIEQLSRMTHEATPAPIAADTNPTTPSAPVTAAPAIAPTPDPIPSAVPSIPAVSNSSDVDAVSLMRSSLQQNPVKEFAIGQITAWNPGPEETFDGETFATGTVSYEATTILGQKTMQAKALIKNGRIEKWIHAKSGIEIE